MAVTALNPGMIPLTSTIALKVWPDQPQHLVLVVQKRYSTVPAVSHKGIHAHCMLYRVLVREAEIAARTASAYTHLWAADVVAACMQQPPSASTPAHFPAFSSTVPKLLTIGSST